MDRLTPALEAAWLDPDWRVASRAVALWRLVPPDRAAVGLVGALDVWTRRALVERGPPTGLGRVRLEVIAALEGLSGRPIGPYPERWRAWLDGVAGGQPLRIDRAGSGTSGAFFGLHLRSGAVAFVLDASGSMAGVFAPGTSAAPDAWRNAPSRFTRAVEELLGALGRAPEPVWFEVLLFESRVRRFAPRPRLADADGLAELREWLAAQRPEGGTDLAGALDALWPQRATAPAFDTVVVLCDGETGVSAAEARAFLARGMLDAGVVVHAVQVGDSPAPALEALAAASGGRFVRVGTH